MTIPGLVGGKAMTGLEVSADNMAEGRNFQDWRLAAMNLAKTPAVRRPASAIPVPPTEYSV
jgi:hypothetical protein